MIMTFGSLAKLLSTFTVRQGGVIVALGLGLPALAAERTGELPVGHAPRHRLLFDDYYHRPRPAELFSQGVALRAEAGELTNHYLPDANAIPNGTFIFAHLIGDRFDVQITRERVSAAQLKGADAYMLVCPTHASSGERASLSEEDAATLEAFVAQGGMLVLVLNSINDPAKTDLDLVGMNRVSRRFGVEFLAKQTNTFSAPIASDHPVFDGVEDVIYGNGTVLRIEPSRAATILLESDREPARGPVGVIVRHQRGKVLAFGDAGTFGNAHAMRGDTGQAQALRQMMYALLPDGPFPRYGWKEGQKLRVTVAYEQMLSGYPDGLRLFELPRPKDSALIQMGQRQIDRDAAANRKDTSAPRQGFATAVSQRRASLVLELGASDGRAYPAIWRTGSEEMRCRLLSRGTTLAGSAPSGDELTAWQGILTHELICAPLKPYIQPGESWEADGLSPVPHAQLSMTPKLVRAPSTFRFEGETTYRGVPCFLITKTTVLDGKSWSPADVVAPESAAQFGLGQVEVSAGGQLTVAKYWIRRETLLPVHTEIQAAGVLWWQDKRFPARYAGTHDSKTYENWETMKFVADFGRRLTADFVIE